MREPLFWAHLTYSETASSFVNLPFDGFCFMTFIIDSSPAELLHMMVTSLNEVIDLSNIEIH